MDAFIPFQVTPSPLLMHMMCTHCLAQDSPLKVKRHIKLLYLKEPHQSIQRCLQGIIEYDSDDYASEHSALCDAVPLSKVVDVAPN